ncbi:streptococcal hemagglutinin [Hoplias malabaricus]|uniref:streptococcal hemagglutinin n=1 Tax=Hoplias malabaricus TaxID=27720 RepID=UPI0034623B4C
MKPDGGATEPAEATEALEAVDIAEEAASEEQPQEEASTLPPQDDKPENVQGAGPEALPPEKETNGKSSQAKPKTKAPVKTKAGTALSKITTSAASRPAPAQSRVANGATRTTANGATKKPANAALEAKKTTTSGAAAQARKVPSVAVVAPRAQTKVAEQKTVGTTRSAVTSTNSVNKTVATAATTPSKKPAGPASSVASKSKTTGPRPATAPAAKPSASAASKPASVPKTTRATTAPAPHSTTSSTSARPTITTTKPASSRTVPAPSAARTASSQASKVSTATASFRKDVGKPTSGVPARKPVATKTTTNSQPLSSKPSKPEPPKSTTAAKRPPVDTKTTRLKTDDRRPVPTQKVQSNISLAASSKKATTSNNQKQGGSSNSILVKRQTSKPTKSVLPLTKGKPAEEHAAEPVEPSSASEVTASAAPTAAIASAEPAPQLEASSAVQLDEPLDQQTSAPMEVQGDEVLQVPASEPSDMETVPTVEQVQVEALAVQPETEPSIPVVSDLVSVPVEQEFKKEEEELFSVEPPTEQEATRQEPVSSQSLEPSAGATVLPKSMDVTEKTEQIIPQDADEEEEEKEGSQQVSVSDMSGTQPTEESRPGSAGLAGSVWRAGGLHSELDSEDVSCSQQGASELSAPGVLEGTESMDDLGEASLKGADGEGVSAGSPDFEKVPDIPANEDDDDDDYDDDDRVCDMEVGSERADDPQRQGHDNGDEDEDEDVEMASEGITESGLESYGNADEDDFAEDYRLDNLNRMQPLPIVPSAPPVAHWDQANPFADPWGQPLQQDPMLLTSPSSSPWQANSKTPVEAPYQAWLEVENAQGGPSSLSPGIMAAIPSSPQHATVPSAENDAGFSPGLALHPQGLLQFDTTSDPEQAANSCSDTSTPEEIKDCNISTGVENQQQQESVTVNPIPALLQDTNQGLGTRIEQGDEEEEPETLPADDVLGGTATAPTSVPSSPSSATEDEASDTEGEMQISDPQTEPAAPDVNECLGSTHVAHSLSTLEEREEACVENEGGGGSDTPQSATSAASYGFDCTNTSNAHSTTESCAKSPGIFSLENEEQLPEEAKDPSLIKELNLAPTSASGDVLEHQDDLQPNPEQHYMLCGKEDEEFPKSCSIDGTEPVEKDLINPSSQHKEEDWDIDAQHPYYSTLSEKTDSSLAGNV